MRLQGKKREIIGNVEMKFELKTRNLKLGFDKNSKSKEE